MLAQITGLETTARTAEQLKCGMTNFASNTRGHWRLNSEPYIEITYN